MKQRKLTISLLLILVILTVNYLPALADVLHSVKTAEAGVIQELEKPVTAVPQYNISKDNTKQLGTAANPFVVLEIVPFEGYAEVGYLIGGCEPIDLEKAKYTDITGDLATIISDSGIYCERTSEYVNYYLDTKPEQYPVLSYYTKCFGYFQKVEDGSGDYQVEGEIDRKNLQFSYVGSGGNYLFVMKEYEPEVSYAEFYTNWNTSWLDVRCTKDGVPSVVNGAMVVSWQMSNSEQIYASNNFYKVTVYNYKNKDFFLKNSVGIAEEEIPDYHIQVVTVTPETLNSNLELIDAANWISISNKAHNSRLLELWRKYYREDLFHPTADTLLGIDDRSVTGSSISLREHDISWDAAVRLYCKISPPSASIDSAPLVFDYTCYADAFQYGSPYTENLQGNIRTFANGISSFFSSTGSVNNIVKLYLMLYLFDNKEDGYFYKNYIQNGLISTRTVNGLTTGCYQYLLDQYPDADAAEVEKLAVYWNKYTFLAIEENDSREPQSVLLENSNILFFDETNDSHPSVKNNVFTFNGDKPLGQDWLSESYFDYKENNPFHSDPFEIPEHADKNIITPQDIMYYLLHKNNAAFQIEINGSMKNTVYSNIDYDAENATAALAGEIVTVDGKLYGRVRFQISLTSNKVVDQVMVELHGYQEAAYDNPATEEHENEFLITDAYTVDGKLEKIRLSEYYYYDVPLDLIAAANTEDVKFSVTIYYRYRTVASAAGSPDGYTFSKALYEYKVQEDGTILDERKTLTFVRRALFNLE